MGYTTYFDGTFYTDKPLDLKTFEALKTLAKTRHGDNMRAFPEFPSFYCQWIPEMDEDGETYIAWDGEEKFYEYIPWLKYIIDNILAPAGYKISGQVEWTGEDSSDFGKICVAENKILILEGVRTYGPSKEYHG